MPLKAGRERGRTRLRDELGTIYSDEMFVGLYPSRGQPAEAPWRLALVLVLQFADGLSDRQAAEALVQRTRAKIGREQAQAIGDINAEFSLQQDFLTDEPIGYVQVGMATPFHHRNEGAIASAQAQYIRACRDLERQRLELRSRFAGVYQEAASARVAVSKGWGNRRRRRAFLVARFSEPPGARIPQVR